MYFLYFFSFYSFSSGVVWVLFLLLFCSLADATEMLSDMTASGSHCYRWRWFCCCCYWCWCRRSLILLNKITLLASTLFVLSLWLDSHGRSSNCHDWRLPQLFSHDAALDDNRTKPDFTHKNCTKINHFAVEKYQPDPRDSTNESNNVIPCKYSEEKFFKHFLSAHNNLCHAMKKFARLQSL